MATTQQTQTTQTPNQAPKTTPSNDGVQSIADALAALPKENEQTMKEFLKQQVANAKNANDELVEQFGSAIDNSEFAASLNEVKDAFSKDAEKREILIKQPHTQSSLFCACIIISSILRE